MILENPSLHATSDDPSVLTCYDPCTGGLLGEVRAHSEYDIEKMLDRARVAQLQWSQTTFEERRRVLQSLSEYIVKHQRDIAQVCQRDSGKTFVDAFFGEILTTLEKLSWVCKYGEECLRDEYRPTGMLTMHKLARVEYHPLGVVSAIVSWNYPFHNTFGPLISALFAGNAILIKSSEHVAWSTTQYFQPLIHNCLESFGYPKDLVQFVIGEAGVGRALVASGVDKVTFIGSPEVGKRVMEAASANLTPVVLELGGKDAAILCDDCDLSQAVPIVMRGTFQNMGQNCIGLEKVVVHSKIYDDFVEQVSERVETMRQGCPLDEQVDCGGVTMSRQLAHIQSMVEDAVAHGARLLRGGRIEKRGNGQFFEPTILADVKPHMRIAQHEVFGPVMSIMRFETDAEAIDLVNATDYGLGTNVFSGDQERAQNILNQLRTGMGNINDFAVNYLCQSLPFGGVKSSGFGRFAGVEGLRGECLVKAVTVDRMSWLKTHIPPVLDYPMKPQSSEFCVALGELIYGQDLSSRARALKNLIVAATAS